MAARAALRESALGSGFALDDASQARMRHSTDPRPASLARAAFAAQLAVVEVVTGGGGRFLAHPADLIGLAASVALWLAAGAWTDGPGRRVVVAASAGALLVAPLACAHVLGAPLDVQTVAVVVHDPSHLHALAPHLSRVVAAWLVVSALDVALLRLGFGRAIDRGANEASPCGAATREPDATTRTRASRSAACDLARRAAAPRWRGAAAALLLVVLTPAWRRASPELRLLHGLTALTSAPERAAPLPRLYSSSREPVPAVLIVVTHGTRSDRGCVGPCPSVDERGGPRDARVALSLHRSPSPVAPFALRSIMTGRSPHPTRPPSAPELDLFAVAAHLHDRGPIILLTARGLEEWRPMTARTYADVVESAESLVGDFALGASTVEASAELVADRCERVFARGPAPRFAVVRLGGVAPGAEIAASTVDRPAYASRIVRDQLAASRCSEAFARAQRSAPFLVFSTSDHGAELDPAEQSAASLGDGLLRVPAVVESGNGALDAGELASLRARTASPSTHLDWFATVIHTWGLTPASRLEPRLRPERQAPLVDGGSGDATVVVSRCAFGEPCGVQVWGVLRGDTMLWARPWDTSWSCEARGAGEAPLPPDAPRCLELEGFASEHLGRMPSGARALPPREPLPARR